jgi:dolichyl-phosphate-mannose--protein O-mannosyl transferase
MTIKDLRRNVLLGLFFGVFLAFWVSAYVTVVYAVAGSVPFEADDTTYRETVAVYFASGTVIGLIAGLVLPLAKRWWGAMIVGAAGALVLWTIFEIADSGAITSTLSMKVLTAEAIGFAITVGPLMGLVLWYVHYRT